MRQCSSRKLQNHCFQARREVGSVMHTNYTPPGSFLSSGLGLSWCGHSAGTMKVNATWCRHAWSFWFPLHAWHIGTLMWRSCWVGCSCKGVSSGCRRKVLVVVVVKVLVAVVVVKVVGCSCSRKKKLCLVKLRVISAITVTPSFAMRRAAQVSQRLAVRTALSLPSRQLHASQRCVLS